MPITRSIAISTGLILSGVLACAFTARPLVKNPELAVPLNALGINGSPYGEVFAMAMQSPIDTYFHIGTGGEVHHHAAGETCDDHDDHKTEEKHTTNEGPKDIPPLTLKAGLGGLLTSLGHACEVRTNPKAASEALKRHLRRETENKLRFAYHLDPSHYANYNSLHFFLTEPQLGTRPQLSASAANLAQETINYCLKKNNDPPAALTAAAAASNMIELMINDQHNPSPRFTTTQMRDILKLLDHCMDRYQILAKHWDETKNWELLSPMRVDECKDRHHFITKIREAFVKILTRLEQEQEKKRDTLHF